MLTRGLQLGGGFQPSGDGGGGGPQLTVQAGTCIAVAHPAPNTVRIDAQVACIQTPWLQNIDANGHTLGNVAHIGVGGPANPAYGITIAGDVNITGATPHYRVNGVPLALPATILTTKGDVLGFSTTPARVPVGTDDQVLMADDSVALGVRWSDLTADLVDLNPNVSGWNTVQNAITGLQAMATPAGANGQVQFNNAGAFGASANLVWDDTNSRLGIGTSTPSTTLSTGPNVAVIKVSTYDAGAGNNYGIGVLSGRLTFGADIHPLSGTPQMVLTNGGNLGIGTQTPAVRLHVIGVAGVSAGLWSVYLEPLSGPATSVLALGQFNNVAAIQASAMGNLVLLPEGGNVGIGTASPAHRLDVAGGVNTTSSYSMSNISGLSRWNLVMQDAETGGNTGSNLYIFRYADNGTVVAAPVILLNRINGFVGINRAAPPQYSLDVNGASRITTSLRLEGSGGAADFTFPGSYLDIRQWFRSVTWTAAGIDLRVSDQAGALAASLRAQSTISGRDCDVSASTDGSISTNSDSIIFRTSWTTTRIERMRITPDGNVGIGTATPNAAYALDVAGDIGLSRNVATWTDVGNINFANLAVGQRVGYIRVQTAAATNSGQMNFYVANAGALNEMLRLDNLGNMLINRSLSFISNTGAYMWLDSGFVSIAQGPRFFYFINNAARVLVRDTDNTTVRNAELRAENTALGTHWYIRARTDGYIEASGSNYQFWNLPSTPPAAGSRELWYDPADGNRVKYAP